MSNPIDTLRAEVERQSLVGAIMLMRWGTRGKGGDEPLTYKRMVDLDADHMRAILSNCRHVRGSDFETAIRTMLETP